MDPLVKKEQEKYSSILVSDVQCVPTNDREVTINFNADGIITTRLFYTIYPTFYFC